MDIQTLIVIESVAINIALAFMVWRNAKETAAGRYLLWVVIGLTGWTVTNHFSNEPTFGYATILWLNRGIFATSTIFAGAFALFTHVFPDKTTANGRFVRILWSALLPVIFLSLSPLVVSDINMTGAISEVVFGPAVSIYGIFTIGCLIYALVESIRKFVREPNGPQRATMRLLVLNIGMFIFLATVTNLLLPLLFDHYLLTVLTPLYASLFAAMLLISIVKYRAFNMKIVFSVMLTLSLLDILFVGIFI